MNDDKVVVGLVGKIGSGKSCISQILFEQYGYHPIEVDKIGHSALEAQKDILVATFGEEILFEDGSINRLVLGNIVFADTRQLGVLNSIVHPKMKENIHDILMESSHDKYVIDAALLFEIGLDEYCDYIISVDAPEENIIERVVTTRKWDRERVQKVIDAQKYLELLKDRTHFIIFNNGGVDKLKKQIEFFVHVIS